MKEDRPSFTAAFVAANRTLGGLLPAHARIADDPFGARFFGSAWIEKGARFPPSALLARFGPLAGMVLYMQVRTRVIDDVLLDFVARGGRQVVLLGAGYDCRALRFREQLAEATIFEIDHPNTQAYKKTQLRGDVVPNVRYLAWNFETQSTTQLPAALTHLGFDSRGSSLTIWEGVTMYLTEQAIEDTVATVAAYAARNSRFIVTYFDRDRFIERPSMRNRLMKFALRRLGEPMQFGWRIGEIGPWLGARGFRLLRDQAEHELARELLPIEVARQVHSEGRRVALFERI